MGKVEDKLEEMRKRRLARRKTIEESKEDKDYREYLENKQKASSLRYAHAKRDQKLKDAMERPQSKIDKYFEVNDE